jgi:hypothetical protein
MENLLKGEMGISFTHECEAGPEKVQEVGEISGG